MKRGGLAILCGVLITVSIICASNAQESVSLVGLNSSRSGDTAVIELTTTAPASFRVNRFALGGCVELYSDKFQLAPGIDEIPLELERSTIDDLVTGASLVSGKHRAYVRIYLSDKADRTGVFIIPDGDTSKVMIPTLGDEPETVEIGMPASAAMDDLSFTGSTEGKAMELLAPTSMNVKVEEQVDEPEDFYSPLDQPVVEDTHDKGSFTIERTNTDKPYSFQQASQPVGSAGHMSDAGGTRLTDLEVHVQQPPVESNGEGKVDDAEINKVLDDLMKQAEELTEQLANPTDNAVQKPSGTGNGAESFYNPYQSAATMSDPMENGATASVSSEANGKESLRKYRIELFEILGTPLDQAITLLVAPTDLNVIVDSSVGENSVSLSFKESQTDLKSALDLITKAYGLDYTVQANTIVVAAAEQINGGLVDYVTRQFVLNYADPLNVKTILINTGLVPENHIEIYDGEKTYLQVNDSTRLSGTAAGVEGEEIPIKPIETNMSSTPRNAVVVKAVPEMMDKIAAVISEIDRKPTRIELEVRVCEANETAMQNLGIEYNIDPVLDTGFISQVWKEMPGSMDTTGVGHFEAFSQGSFERSGYTLATRLNHEAQDGNVELLAQPTLVTVEGKQAIYFAGEEIPYVKEVTRDDSGVKFTVAYVNIGVTLNFKPRLDENNMITIDVNPEVSSLLEFVEFPSGLQAPRSQRRQLATTVRVHDQEPFVLAGLIQESERKSVRKIPFLGDLPLVGKLFRNKNTKNERTEIIIIVTPKLVNN